MQRPADSPLWDELQSQPRVWEQTIARVTELFAGAPDSLPTAAEIVLCGCGSAYNCALAVAPIFRAVAHICVRAEQAADVALYPEAHLWRPQESLVVAFSRSGTTEETTSALMAAHDLGAATFAITCRADSPIPSEADGALVLEFADEASAITTRSTSAMMVACQMIAGLAGGNGAYVEGIKRLPGLGDSLLRQAGELHNLATDPGLRRFVVLGASHLYGAAREGALKLTEMTLLPTEASPALDYSHGAIVVAGEDLLAVVLGTEAARAQEAELVADLAARGAATLVIGPHRVPQATVSLKVEAGGGDSIAAPLMLLMPQVLAYQKAQALGLNPDAPTGR